jgi:hypothetical protein
VTETLEMDKVYNGQSRLQDEKGGKDLLVLIRHSHMR